MLDVLVIAMGWPSILTSLGLSLTGIARKRQVLLLIGALLVVPFAYYLNASPRFAVPGAFLPMLHLGAAVAVYRGHRWLALLLLLPFIAVTIWLAVAVLTQ